LLPWAQGVVGSNPIAPTIYPFVFNSRGLPWTIAIREIESKYQPLDTIHRPPLFLRNGVQGDLLEEDSLADSPLPG
jgi:hypothetical protein